MLLILHNNQIPNQESFAQSSNMTDVRFRFVKQLGEIDIGDGQFLTPRGNAMDQIDNVCVVDSKSNRVQKFNSQGNFVAQIGKEGSNNDDFISPISIDVVSDNVYMTEAFPNFRVQKLASNGNFITKFSLKLLEDEFSPNPTDIVIDSRGIIYVLDSYNSQIQVFSPNKNNTSDNELDVDDIDLSDKSENTNRTVNESTLLPEIRAGITDQI